ncbi:hypothetical protein E2C01_099852 [Portunus trituberculatus]|uniref:Uncharacterized protein n=1 Tax=Portunus trituberculatus TaxID=210409 RepID=A0A5B7KBZ6_PORTR|nr:hypothetical protein [Portunus trituberculatus]
MVVAAAVEHQYAREAGAGNLSWRRNCSTQNARWAGYGPAYWWCNSTAEESSKRFMHHHHHNGRYDHSIRDREGHPSMLNSV